MFQTTSLISLTLLLLFGSSLIRADELSVPSGESTIDGKKLHSHTFNDASQAGNCDAIVTEKYVEILQKLELQHVQQLDDVRAQSKLQLTASAESVQEYKDLAEQAQRDKLEMQHQLEEKLAAAEQEASDRYDELQNELEQLNAQRDNIEKDNSALVRELSVSQKRLVAAKEKFVDIQSKLDLIREEMKEMDNQYINWRLIRRRTQETKDAIASFYSDKFLPFLDAIKDSVISSYQKAVELSQQLRIALGPVLEATEKLLWRLIAQAKVLGQHITDFLSPHYQAVREAFNEKAGPRMAVTTEKFRALRNDATRHLHASPVYPYIVQGTHALEQLQKYITDGCFKISKALAVFLQRHEVPATIVACVLYATEHPAMVVIYLEFIILFLFVVLLLNSISSGTNPKSDRTRTAGQATTHQKKVKKA